MRKFKLSVNQYRAKLESEFGFADPDMVRRYAEAKQAYKMRLQDGDFDPFNADPNCKSCGKRNIKGSPKPNTPTPEDSDDSGNVNLQPFDGYSHVLRTDGNDEN